MTRNSIRNNRWLVRVLLAAAIASSTAVFANASGVTCRTGPSCLNGSDGFDWTANYGPPFSDVPNNSVARSNGGLAAIVQFAGGGDGQRRDQGNGWSGNFSRGDELLWTNSPGQGPLTLTFSSAVGGVGANIQADFFGPFTALIQAFDRKGHLIDSFAENGDSNPNGDGSAIFIGLVDPGIQSVTFSLVSCAQDCKDFAINQLDTTACCGPPVAEPASLLLLGSGLVGVARVFGGRKKARV